MRVDVGKTFTCRRWRRFLCCMNKFNLKMQITKTHQYKTVYMFVLRHGRSCATIWRQTPSALKVLFANNVRRLNLAGRNSLVTGKKFINKFDYALNSLRKLILWHIRVSKFQCKTLCEGMITTDMQFKYQQTLDRSFCFFSCCSFCILAEKLLLIINAYVGIMNEFKMTR